MSILVVVSIAGCSPQIMEAAEPPNFASVPILLQCGSVAMEDNKKSCPPGGVMVEWSHDGAIMIATFIVVITLILIIIAQWGYSRANCKHIRANCNHFE
jgi:hypothetical protein